MCWRTNLEVPPSKDGRHGVRDHLLMMWRHGLRVSEAVGLGRDQINLQRARVWIQRLKNSLSVEHPIDGEELRAIKRYLNTRDDKLPWLFVNERRLPMTRQAVNYVMDEAGKSLVDAPHRQQHGCVHGRIDPCAASKARRPSQRPRRRRTFEPS